jgi:hypothetical protein
MDPSNQCLLQYGLLFKVSDSVAVCLTAVALASCRLLTLSVQPIGLDTIEGLRPSNSVHGSDTVCCKLPLAEHCETTAV